MLGTQTFYLVYSFPGQLEARQANIFYAYTANDLKELNKNDLIVIFPRKNTNFIMTCLNTVNLSVLKLFSEM